MNKRTPGRGPPLRMVVDEELGRMRHSSDRVRFALELPMVDEPGTLRSRVSCPVGCNHASDRDKHACVRASRPAGNPRVIAIMTRRTFQRELPDLFGQAKYGSEQLGLSDLPPE